MNVKQEVIAGGAALVTLAGMAVAGYQYSTRHKDYHRDFDLSTIEKLTGTITGVVSSGKENSENKGMELILQSGKKMIPVHLGPTWYLDKQHIKFKKGETVSVKGSLMVLDNNTVMIAQELKQGKKLLSLRDSNGHPHWVAWEHLS